MKIKVAAVKRHSLVCSQKLRAGKFSRVGEDFVQKIEACLEQAARMIGQSYTMAALPTDEYFLTHEGERHILDNFNSWMAKSIQKSVQAHPSLGKTLKA